ncbi:hypothetical protein QL285_021151 [Trifolium repens]|nr:hypothetical protein QL285_021151 [Trifolium repens]
MLLLHRYIVANYNIASSSPLWLYYYFIVVIKAITSSSPLWLLLHRRHYGYILLLLIAITGYIIFTPSLPYLATALLLHCHIWLQYYSFIAISGYSITTSLPYLATILNQRHYSTHP